MAKIIMVWFEKGGTGKTTVSYNLAGGLCQAGKKALLVDVDPAGGSTKHAGFDPATVERSLSDVFCLLMAHQEVEVEKYTYETEDGFSILPANGMLEALAGAVKNVFGDCQTIFCQILSKVQDQYDYIIIDGSPSRNIYNLSALAAANEVIMPMRPNFLDYKCVEEALETIQAVRTNWNPDLKIRGALLTQFKKTKHSELVKNALEDIEIEEVKSFLLPVQISYGVDLAEASIRAQSIYRYKSWSKQAREFSELIEVILHG